MTAQMNGGHRVYQDGSRYYLPKDAPEQERLENQSQSLVALMNNQPFHAPLSSPKKILDVGCGTGSMTELLATSYPEAQIYGVDMAPVPETGHKNIQNVEYVQGDIRELIGADPRFEPGTFDYVFQRFFVCVSFKNWPAYVESIARLLKPGGWLEFQEPSMQLRSATGESLIDSESWFREFKKDATEVGVDCEIGDRLLEIFKNTPMLENIQQSKYPFAPVPSEERPELYALERQIPQLFALLISKICGGKRGEEAAEKISNDLKSMWENGFKHTDHFNVFAVTAQKA